MGIRWICTEEESRWQELTAGDATGAEPNLSLTGEEFQTLKGFGGCFNEMGYDRLLRLKESDQDAVIQSLFSKDGCDFGFCRVPIGASDYAMSWYSHAPVEDDYEMKHFGIDRDRGCLVPYIKRAQAAQPDLTMFASPWSPPVWMKTEKVYNNGNIRWEEPVLKAYALYFQKFVEAYAAEGITVEQIHVQNEPRSNQKFPSCVWTAEHMRDFIRDYLGPQFETAGFDCEIWLGTIEKGIEHGWDPVWIDKYSDWPHAILRDPEARKYIGGIGLQWDSKGIVQRINQTWPDIPIIQTENECGNSQNTWEYAQYVFDLMWQFFNNGAIAYTYWNMILRPGGESTWAWGQNSLFTVTDEGELLTNPEFYVMKHASHFIKPGAVRLGLKGEWSGFAYAFRNTDGTTAVVLMNPYDEEADVVLDVGDTASLKVPPQSFNTFIF